MKNMPYIIGLLISGWMLSGCTYYEVIQIRDPQTNPKAYMALQNKTIILHGKERIYLLENAVIDNGRQTISGVLDSVPAYNRVYLNQARRNKRYTKMEKAVISEAHIFSYADSGFTISDTVTIPMKSIDRLDIIKNDGLRNTFAIIGPVLLTALTISAYLPYL